MNEAPIRFWSFSAVKAFEACPYYMYLDRVEQAEKPDFSEDPKHPLVRGDRIHTEAEEFIKGDGPLTKDLNKFTEKLQDLRELYDSGRVYVEEKWGFNRDWRPVDWKERWAGVICDVVIVSEDGRTITVIDWKSGKSMNKEVPHQQQLQLYAAATLMKFPDADLVIGQMAYLDEGKVLERKIDRSRLPYYIQRWTSRGEALTSATSFPPKPNTMNCKYCDFGPTVGTGVCPYAPDPL